MTTLTTDFGFTIVNAALAVQHDSGPSPGPNVGGGTLEARFIDGGSDNPLEAAFEPFVPDSQSSSSPASSISGLGKTPWNQTKVVQKSIPNDMLYQVTFAPAAAGRRLVELLKKVSWPEQGYHFIGWRGSEVPTSSDDTGPPWRAITTAAAKIADEYFRENPRWTYSLLSMAKGTKIEKLTTLGGVGGNLLWVWALKGGVAAKIGHSRRFNAQGRLIEYNSKTAASLRPGGEETCAVLFHNVSQEPFESEEAKKTVKELALAPEPLSEEEEYTVAEDETDASEADEDFPTRTGGVT